MNNPLSSPYPARTAEITPPVYETNPYMPTALGATAMSGIRGFIARQRVQRAESKALRLDREGEFLDSMLDTTRVVVDSGRNWPEESTTKRATDSLTKALEKIRANESGTTPPANEEPRPMGFSVLPRTKAERRQQSFLANRLEEIIDKRKAQKSDAAMQGTSTRRRPWKSRSLQKTLKKRADKSYKKGLIDAAEHKRRVESAVHESVMTYPKNISQRGKYLDYVERSTLGGLERSAIRAREKAEQARQRSTKLQSINPPRGYRPRHSS